YPSGDLHIGHWFAMTPSDARARYMRLKGYNVMFPMGFDAFGLPAENAAIQRGIHPATWTHANIERMRKQLKSMGAMFDWEREAISCEPEYYKWTEWFFKTFYENEMAYRGEAMVNWSPTLQTVLANEQVIDGKDERTGQPVIQKMMTQWFFEYTRYADEMLNFDQVDFPDPIKVMQSNWIGRSEGAHVTFKTDDGNDIEIYTTRPDTLWGATFMVLAPEHKLVDQITTPEQRQAVDAYIKQSARTTEIERTSESREKTGVFTGGYAINPVNQQRIPVWIADYVMVTYGTGAIMAVPYGDQRDFEFARKYDLPIVAVVKPHDTAEIPDPATMTEAYAGPGVMVNSGAINGKIHNGEKGRKSPAISAVLDWLEAQKIGQEAINYRLRDWLISRQRYWGSPIPMIYREDGGIEPVRDDQLPVRLPDDVKMTGAGNPLAQHESFVNTFDSDENPARRETDTMDTFMCSSWYHLRYLSPHYDAAPFNPEEAAYWLPVDTYTGGAEHATMHLLYARWFNKAMRDSGVFDDAIKIMQAHGRDAEHLLDEPWLLLRNQGQILGEERRGDYLVIEAEHVNWDDITKPTTEPTAITAKRIEVVPFGTPVDKPGQIAGELIRRSEYSLRVRLGNGNEIPVSAKDAVIEIPGIDGENTVNQLKHHLEIQRMSKSKGNVINPDEMVAQYGADTVRAYLMFGFDWTKGGPWDSKGVQGPMRWVQDMWEIGTAVLPASGDPATEKLIERRVHQTIEKISRRLENFEFNTTVSALMELRNELKPAMREGKLGKQAYLDAMHIILRLMAPITPHIAEELWQYLGFGYSVHLQDWPQVDPAKAAEDVLPLVIMVNGKVRDRIDIPAGTGEGEAKAAAMASDTVRRFMNDTEPKRVIFIGG
ncbi:MAG TPA: leucine--tRNA ligase, partial [Phototrophicaceae bacterium]|nr:leucine--tRNA ligase [Phototrophicaceae bacterium]